MVTRPLNHSELFTLATKDEQYCNEWVSNDIQELAQRCLGVRKWIQLRSAIIVLSRFGYFGASIFSGYPTPGEEFCEAKCCETNPLRRILVVLLNNELKLPKEVPKSYATLLRDVHLTTFYLFGDFYELAKRALNLNYVTDSDNLDGRSRPNYSSRLVGLLSLARLLLNLPKLIDQQTEDDDTTTVEVGKLASETDKQVDASVICHLCSSTRTVPTSTICGHIFCWNCIHRWLKERDECPICRTPTEPSRLIHLINFR